MSKKIYVYLPDSNGQEKESKHFRKLVKSAVEWVNDFVAERNCIEVEFNIDDTTDEAFDERFVRINWTKGLYECIVVLGQDLNVRISQIFKERRAVESQTPLYYAFASGVDLYKNVSNIYCVWVRTYDVMNLFLAKILSTNGVENKRIGILSIGVQNTYGVEALEYLRDAISEFYTINPEMKDYVDFNDIVVSNGDHRENYSLIDEVIKTYRPTHIILSGFGKCFANTLGKIQKCKEKSCEVFSDIAIDLITEKSILSGVQKCILPGASRISLHDVFVRVIFGIVRKIIDDENIHSGGTHAQYFERHTYFHFPYVGDLIFNKRNGILPYMSIAQIESEDFRCATLKEVFSLVNRPILSIDEYSMRIHEATRLLHHLSVSSLDIDVQESSPKIFNHEKNKAHLNDLCECLTRVGDSFAAVSMPELRIYNGVQGQVVNRDGRQDGYISSLIKAVARFYYAKRKSIGFPTGTLSVLIELSKTRSVAPNSCTLAFCRPCEMDNDPLLPWDFYSQNDERSDRLICLIWSNENTPIKTECWIDFEETEDSRFLREVLKNALCDNLKSGKPARALNVSVWGDTVSPIYCLFALASAHEFSVQDVNRFANVCSIILPFYHSCVTQSVARIKSIQSAIGSIMSRNGSHNIGSHVLSALTHNVGTMPDDRVLYQYVQHRMDYMASATTDFPDWSVPTKFVAEVMKLFYSQRHLLNHIAGSEGLHAYEYQGKKVKVSSEQSNCLKIIVRKVVSADPRNSEWKSFPFNKTTMLYCREFLIGTDATNDWLNDVSLALPGGILGQHAFYNIIENVIRNAAKHAWSSKSEDERKVLKNLEIYVDFKDEDEKQDIVSFTIGDNVSELFPQKSFWNGFFDWLDAKGDEKTNLEMFGEILDKENWKFREEHLVEGKVTAETVKKSFAFALSYNVDEPYCKSVKEYLSGHGDVKTLPPWYRILYKYITDNWKELSQRADFKSLLVGTDPGDGTLGHRLPLPLHHRQEIELSKPFVDPESNQMRQSSWGLAEMKISAGYLRRAKISVVGGLSDPTDRPLIVPIGIPIHDPTDEKNDESGGVSDDVLKLHLGYRFWIAKPKSILILTDSPAKWSNVPTDGAEISVRTYADAVAKVGLMADYGFVVVDHQIDPTLDVQRIKEEIEKEAKKDSQTRTGEECKRKAEENCKKRAENEWRNLLKLPFHSLFVSETFDKTNCAKCQVEGCPMRILLSDYASISSKEMLDAVNANDKSEEEKVSALKALVYAVWLNYLKDRRGIERKQLTIRMNVANNSGREKGLVTDHDICCMVFRECFHSVIQPFADDLQLTKPERIAALLLSLYPIDVDADDFASVSDIDEGLEKALECLKRFLEGILISLTKEPFDGPSNNATLPKTYVNSLQRARTTLRFAGLVDDAEDALHLRKSSHLPLCPTRLLDQVITTVKDMNRHEWGQRNHFLYDRMRTALDVAMSTSDVFLRKYEEHIATLPTQYQAARTSADQKELAFDDIGVRVTYGPADDAEISYNRHDFDHARLYSEPISGSQSYMNAMANIKQDDVQLVMRMTESALLRILIIDERVCGFITNRSNVMAPVYESMHLSVADTRKGRPCDDQDKPLEGLRYVAHGIDDEKYDVLIIHQGIIDKWWLKHSRNDVHDLLQAIRRSGLARYVVITTGRGRPDNIPENEKVLPFAVIESLLFRRYPEKLTLVNSLMNILPYENESERENQK